MELKFVHNDLGEFMPNKAKVFFSCHPDDFKYFNEISKEILDISYCFFYYALEDGKLLDKEEWEFTLKEMSLLVVPITKKYLTTPNRAFDVDLEIARRNHIAILPIMCEEDIVDLFNEKFGEYQFLNKVSTDKTEVAYKDKLSDFLKSVIISHEKTLLVMQNFKGLVFLSYRKKDRAEAQKLMKEIHNDKDLYDLCIWYDEFLTPGENFNEEISMILQASNLMILNVTPSIVEDGNYIIQVEYPNAVALNKLVLPIEMVKTDKDKLESNYDYLPKVVDVSDKQTILKQIKKALGKKFYQVPTKNKTEHKYYVALGYIDGLGVAKDKDLGIKLLEECAKEGYEPAVYDLSNIYILGKGVPQDIEKGFSLRNMLIDKAYKKATSKNIKEKLIGISQYLTEILEIAPFYYLLGKVEEVDKLSETCSKFIKEVEDYKAQRKLPHKLDVLHSVNLLKFCINMGTRFFARGKFKEALEYLLLAVKYNKIRIAEMWREVHGNIPIDPNKEESIVALESYDSIGVCYLNLEDYENAEKYLTKCCEKIKEILSNEEFYETLEYKNYIIKYGLVITYLADLYTKTRDFEKAEKLFKETIKNQEMLVSQNGETFEDSLISFITHLAKVYVEQERYNEAEKELLRAKSILDRHLAVKDKSLYLVQIGFYHLTMGDLLFKLGKKEEALKNYQKSIIQYIKLKNDVKIDELDQKINACKEEN